MSEFKTNKISPRKGTTQTIGDSGDTLSIPCGVTVTNAGTITTAGISGGTINNTSGTISGLQGVIEWDTTAKTTGFTAVSNKGYFCNTTSAAFTVTLPASPTAGDVIALKDYANTFDTNNLTLNANGNKIQGATSNFIISVEGANSQFIYVDSTRGWVLTDASKASDISEAANFIAATGGTITCCGDYKIHTFTSPGTFTVTQIGNAPTNPLGGPQNVDYLVVAGGGGGGNPIGGGGGAGGHRTTFPSPGCNAGSFPITATAFPITVGAGGSAVSQNNRGADGSNSVFSTITSAGGGGGGAAGCGGSPVPVCSPARDGEPGGSGGGGAASQPVSNVGLGGTGNTPPVSPPQGNNGGGGGNGPFYGGGGGGGSSGTGSDGIRNPSNSPGPGGGGPGGAGTTNLITGSPVTKAGGGGGGAFKCGGAPASTGGGTGGSGGGGVGATGCGPAGGSGTVNTGSGGGGGMGACTAGAGGSGIVIIRYKYQ